MPDKILFVATVDYHFKVFHLPYLEWLQAEGWEVHVAANGSMELPYVRHKYNLPIGRSPLHKGNLAAYRELKSIIDTNEYDIVHCHTPVGGVMARLAAREARKRGTKVIYTAHGFHFCKGSPYINWMIYYPIERLFSHITDCLITINDEDYELALKHRFKAGRIEHVHGVGVDTARFQPVEEQRKRELRKSFGYGPRQLLMFYAAEFNKNKNQQLLIRALANIKNEVPHAKLLLAGEGPLLEGCKQLAAELGVAHLIDFLGYRNDIEHMLPMCDIAVASSSREGLPVNVMEAMACGLPVVATDNRGHRELVRSGVNGWLAAPDDHQAIGDKIKRLSQDRKLTRQLGMSGRGIIEAQYAIDTVLKKKSHIYSSFMDKKVEAAWTTQ